MINDSKLLSITDQKHSFLKAMATVTLQSIVDLICNVTFPRAVQAKSEHTQTPKS